MESQISLYNYYEKLFNLDRCNYDVYCNTNCILTADMIRCQFGFEEGLIAEKNTMNVRNLLKKQSKTNFCQVQLKITKITDEWKLALKDKNFKRIYEVDEDCDKGCKLRFWFPSKKLQFMAKKRRKFEKKI